MDVKYWILIFGKLLILLFIDWEVKVVMVEYVTFITHNINHKTIKKRHP